MSLNARQELRDARAELSYVAGFLTAALVILIAMIMFGCASAPAKPIPLPIPPAPPHVVTFDSVVCAVPAVNDHCNSPIVGAQVTLDGAPPAQTSDQAGYNVWTVPASLVDTFVAIDAPGYVHFYSGTVHPVDLAAQHNIFALTSLVAPRPSPETRAPLGPFDRATTDPDTGAALPVATTLPAASCLNDPAPTPRCWRGNAWSVTIPGLPFVAGGSAIHPERALTWFLDRWSLAWQQQILAAHARRGYTHFALSWPDSRDGNGQSVAAFVATASRVKAAGFYVAVFLGSKDFDPHDEGVNGWVTRADPVLDALLAAKAIDVAIVCWECDAFNVPGPTLQAIIDHVTAKTVPAGVLTYVHFLPEHISWQADGSPGAAFWIPNVGKLTGILYQGVSEWSVGMLQARLNDVQVRLAGANGYPSDSGFGHPFDVVAWELDGSLQFDGDVDEDAGDLRGYEAVCGVGPIPIMGFGNGARRPDGRPF